MPSVAGRVKPLIGLPLVGTGDGGFETRRGVLIEELVPVLRKAARDHEVDVALVLNDHRDHAAVQAVRKPKYWKHITKEHPQLAHHMLDADELGLRAARKQLSLFLGSGVSVPLGLPNWRDLLERVSDRRLKKFDVDHAPAIAQEIKRRIGRRKLEKKIQRNVNVVGVAPTHLLLAALDAVQNVTTNYDTAYERALDKTIGLGKYRVLTEQLALQPDPWLLKYHGCVNHPKTIVITTSDYKRLRKDHGALQSLVEALMLTSHLLFVGFSMADADFVDAAKRVKAVRALAHDVDKPDIATVLALHPDAVSEEAGFNVIPMLDESNDAEAARLLEIFLDRVSWRAAIEGPESSAYLLHPKYKELFAKHAATAKLRDLLVKLNSDISGDLDMLDGKGYDKVREMLTRLGAP